MTRRLPFKSIRSLGVDLSVELDHDPKKPSQGDYDAAANKITIAAGPIQSVIKTLIHELVHHWQYHLDVGPEDDDKQANRLETAIFDLIRGNPDVVRFLMRKRW